MTASEQELGDGLRRQHCLCSRRSLRGRDPNSWRPRLCSPRSQHLNADPPRQDPVEAVSLQLLFPCPLSGAPHRSPRAAGSRRRGSGEQSRSCKRKGERAPTGPRALPGLPTSPRRAGDPLPPAYLNHLVHLGVLRHPPAGLRAAGAGVEGQEPPARPQRGTAGLGGPRAGDAEGREEARGAGKGGGAGPGALGRARKRAAPEEPLCHRRTASSPAGRAGGGPGPRGEAGERGGGGAGGPRAAAQPGRRRRRGAAAAREPGIAGTLSRAHPPGGTIRRGATVPTAPSAGSQSAPPASSPLPPGNFRSLRHGGGAVCRRPRARLKARCLHQGPRRAFEPPVAL